MRDNFRPNVRLTTNILMVIGTFLIAFNLASVGKQDKEFKQRRDDCAEAASGVINVDDFIKKYKIGENLQKQQRNLRDPYQQKVRLFLNFCRYYGGGGLGGR